MPEVATSTHVVTFAGCPAAPDATFLALLCTLLSLPVLFMPRSPPKTDKAASKVLPNSIEKIITADKNCAGRAQFLSSRMCSMSVHSGVPSAATAMR